jgi:plasmid maintenance system antidote protein VapI
MENADLRVLRERSFGTEKVMYPNLKLQMWRSGIRQNRLAQLLKMDETSLSRIVNGFRKAGPDVRMRIAAALASDQDWLFEESADSRWEQAPLAEQKDGS